jgi:hypothetical protein
MKGLKLWAAAAAALSLTACAAALPVAPAALQDVGAGWTPAPASVRPVGLGLPGGAYLAEGVTFAGGIELVLGPASPLHSLSDFKLIGDNGFISVSDAGDLVRGRLVLDRRGRLIGVEALRHRRLTLRDGTPIADKADGDAEGLAMITNGDLLVSFERDHRIWNYGPPDAPAARPEPVRRPEFAFPLNDGMEGVSVRPGGWRAAGESGGVWDCSLARCDVVTAPPETPLADSDFRITGMDRDSVSAGFFVVQRSYRRPIDVRANVRRLDENGVLGPILVALSLPGTTDNFEGIAAVAQGDATRLYILSDDNNNRHQRTLLLAFDVIR